MTETVSTILADKKNTRLALAEWIVLLKKHNDGFEAANFELGEEITGLSKRIYERDKTILYIANLLANGATND